MKRQEARERARRLVARMTLEERASQLRYDAPAIKRLRIPAYNWWNEALHGVARAGNATVFPQAIGLGATFDEALLRRIGEAIGREARAKYNVQARFGDRDIYKGLTFWSPNVNIFRDPRWGRGQETYGEDPYLTARLGVGFVRGLQGTDPAQGGTMLAAACAKHFAVHSGPEGERHRFDARVSKKDLAETYLPAFEALVREAKVEAVMGAYNRVNGEPACASAFLQEKLRGEWGFEGHFVSDCWAIRDFFTGHGVSENAVDAAALAVNRGCDLNCGSTYQFILEAYERGLVSEETITEACVRLFTTRYMLGLFGKTGWDNIPYTEVESPEHLDLARKAALESAVLLKNDGVLPLDREKIKTLGVIGPNADSRRALLGNYHGSASRYITVQEGLQDYLYGSGIRILTSVGCELVRDRTEGLARSGDRLSEAAAVCEASDAVILVLGLDETLEGEEGDASNSYASGDRETLELPKVQRELMELAAKAGKPTVLCLMAGSAVDLSFAEKHFGAILDLWYPGSMGGRAAAEILFGEQSPSGKLPVTFYRRVEDLPPFEDYAMTGRTYRYFQKPVQYPFGYGLTYGNVIIRSARLKGDAQKGFTLEADIGNRGPRDTGEVLQVYCKRLDSPDAPPNPVLCAMKRVFLPVWGHDTVSIPLPARAFTVVDGEGNRHYGGKFRIFLGTGQPDKRTAALTGKTPLRFEVTVPESENPPDLTP